MKIIVNAVGYVGQSGGAGGAGVFLRYLVEQLAQDHIVDVLIAQGSNGFGETRSKVRLIELPYLTGETLRHLRDGPTVVLDPFGALPCASFPDDMALCIVVHDLMHLDRPHFFTASEREDRSRTFAAGLQRADAVVTFSGDQARATKRYFPGTVPTVIHHLPYAALTKKLPSELYADVRSYEPFLLFPAVKWPHKNHRTVIEAFRSYIAKTGSKLRLLLCGGPCAESRFSYYPAPHLIPDQVTDLGLISDSLLAALFEKANAVLFPTLYEGFGIPVLEAAYSRKMVIASRLDVFDEILGSGVYCAVEDPLCQMRWMEKFSEAEGKIRKEYEKKAITVADKVSSKRFLDQFIETLKSAADRYTHPSLYPVRGFRSLDRPTTAVVAALNFSDIYGVASIERGGRNPIIGEKPETRASTVFRSIDAAPERRVCLRANYDAAQFVAPVLIDTTFSAWVRLQSDDHIEAINWSVNDGDVFDMLPELKDREWHLIRRKVPLTGFIDFRAIKDGISESVGFDLEIHDACILQLEEMKIPNSKPLSRGITVFIDALSKGIDLKGVLDNIVAVNKALGSKNSSLIWILVTYDAALGDIQSSMLPKNVRFQFVPSGVFNRADAARLCSPYEPIDQLLLLSAFDLIECLDGENLSVLAGGLVSENAASPRRLVLNFFQPSIWVDDERGCILDVSYRIGQPIPVLDREVIQSSIAADRPKIKRRFAVIETDKTGGISHHSAVTALFLEGAAACGFKPLIGVNKDIASSEDDRLDVWAGFSSQVYLPGTADDFFLDLTSFTDAKKLGADDIIFLHSLSPQILLGIARFVAANGSTSPNFILRFFSTAEAMRGHGLSYTKILKSISASRVVQQKMHFFCESKNLINYYEERLGLKFPLLLNPEHPDLVRVRNSGWFDQALQNDQKMTLAYFGEARSEKGFGLIPGILEALLTNPDMKAFRFLIQIGSNNANQTPDMNRAKASLSLLKAKYKDRIRTFESAETSEEFYFLMKHTVGVISPYSPDAYGTRGTGVTLEALQMGLDVFAWEDTDLYATFRETGRVIGVGKTEDFAQVISRHYAKKEHAPDSGIKELRQPPAQVCKYMLSHCRRGFRDRENEAPPLLWVGNDTFGEGCSAVYASQKRALQEVGRDCFELFVPWPDRNWRGQSSSAFDGIVYGFESQYEGTGLAWVARPKFGDQLDLILDKIERSGPTYALLRDLNKHMEVPESLRLALAANSVEQTLLNYVHLYPVIEAEMSPDQVICETHDVLSYQHAVRRGTPISLTEKIDEFSDLAKFPTIIAISASEQREMQTACPGSEVVWRLPPFLPEKILPLGNDKALESEFFSIGTELDETVVRPSPVMFAVYQSRPDLQRTFNLANLSDRLAFFRWWVFFGQFEHADHFSLTQQQFDWLVGRPGVGEPASALSGLMRLMLVHRGDLRTEFSTPQGFDAIGLQLWADEHAERELGVSERSLLAKAERFLGRAMRDATVMDSPLDAVVAAEPVATGGTISEFGTLFERIHDLGTIDMVLVGSGHPSNVASFEWFISKVYLPYLAPVGRSLFIAGSACAALQKHSHRGLVLLGRCKSIEPLLRASITCPLPVIAGSGAPIKTIPALALNGAVTVTEHIERAFLLSSYGIPHFSEPKAFADDIRGLLTDVGKREARVGAARRYAEEKLSLSGYVEFWRERLT